MDYKLIDKLLPQEAPGLTDYDRMVESQRAKSQAALAQLDEMQSLVDYTTPPQLKAQKLQEIEGQRSAITAERNALETNEDFLRRYAGSREQAAFSPAPTASRAPEPFIQPAPLDLAGQPQLSTQSFEPQEAPLMQPAAPRPGDTAFEPYPLYPEADFGMEGEFLKAIPRGAANMVAAIPALAGAGQASSNRDAAGYLDEAEAKLVEMADMKARGMDQIEFIQQSSRMIDNAPPGIRQKISLAIGAINNGDDPQTVIQKFRRDISALPLETAKTEDFQTAKRMGEAIEGALPVTPGYEDGWTRKIGEGAGSLIPMIAGSAINPALGIGIGMLSGGGSAAQEAVQDKAPEDDILNYSLAGTAIGSLEALPVGKLLGIGSGMVGGTISALEKAAPQTMSKVSAAAAKLSPLGRSKLAQVATKLAEQGIEEGTQEAVSQTLLNAAGKLTYDEDRSLMEGVGEAALIGGIVGGGVKGVQMAGSSAIENARKKAPATPPETPPTPAAPPTAEPAAPGGPGGALGGLEGEIVPDGTEVTPAEPVAGGLNGKTIDGDLNTDRNPVAPKPNETGLGGLEGEIVSDENAVTPAEPVRGALDGRTIDGSVNREAIGEQRKLEGRPPLEGSTDDYEVIDDGDTPATEPEAEPAPPAQDEMQDLVKASERISTPAAPIRVQKPEDVDVAGQDAREPTEAQVEAGNYQKGHVKLDGLDITIETPKGAERKGIDSDGNPWSVTMPGHYGYVKRSKGMDGDHVDVTIGPDPASDSVFVIDQVDADTKTADEHKVILGTKSPEEARALYEGQFSDGRGPDRLGGMVQMSRAEFKDWVKNGDTTKPIAATAAPAQVIDTATMQPAAAPTVEPGTAAPDLTTPPAGEKPDLKAMMQEVRAKNAAREEEARTAAAPGKPVKLAGKDGRYALASKDTVEKGFRLTYFDDKGPSGHTGHNTLEEAVLDGLKQGYSLKETGNGTPAKPELRNIREPDAGPGPGLRQPGSPDQLGGTGDRVDRGAGEVRRREEARRERGVQNKSPRAQVARERNRGRHASDIRPFVEAVDGAEKLDLTHFSDDFRDTIVPQDGWRSRGAERDRASSPDFVPRSYYGIGVGKEGGYRKDVKGGAGHVTSIDPDDLYDFASDPDKLNTGKGVAAYEKAIREAGYAGYTTRVGLKGDGGPAAVVFEEAKVERQFDDGLADEPGVKRAKGLETSVPLGKTGKRIKVAPVPRAREAKALYSKRSGIRPATTIREYVKVDEARAKRIADAFEEMKHDPRDPQVQAAYSAMIRETLDQFQAMLDSGFKVEMIAKGMKDPYAASPRLAIEDIRKNNHMWVFPTDDGFGSSDLDVSDNPLLAETEFSDINGRTMLANDVFRAVHDYFGHAVEGNGMRARGEEMAWRVHASMYSPLARRAMTTETRGQNSWVNYGPFSEANQTASGSDTVYAPQKIGLLPEWVSNEGLHDPTHLANIEKAKKMMREKKANAPARKPASLIEYIARNGGIKDQGGELKSIGLTNRKTGFVSGAGPVVRETGRNPDRVREMVEQAGYLPEGSTLADLYDALDRDARSGREVFSFRDDVAVERWRAAQAPADPGMPFFGDETNPDYPSNPDTSLFKLGPDTGGPAFKRWFGDSKVVSDGGDPLVVYHGTNGNFSSFSNEKLGETTGAASSKMGFFFASNPAVASSYAETFNYYTDTKLGRLMQRLSGGLYSKANEALVNRFGKSGLVAGANVMPVYLKIENPEIVDFNGSRYRERTYAEIIAKAKRDGRDGVILRNTFDEGFMDGGDAMTDVYVAFSPNQIKSTANQGTFDAGNSDILYKISPGFYSAVTKGVEGAKQKAAPAKDWKSIIAALPGVRKAEIEWIGVNEWLDEQSGQVTREDLVNFIKANEIEIHETVLTSSGRKMGSDARFDVEIDSDPEPVEPDDEWIDEMSSEYMDDIRDEMQDRLDEDEEVDEDEVKERAREMALSAYYENPDYQGSITISYADGTSAGYSYSYSNDSGYYFDGEDYSDMGDLRLAAEEMAEREADTKGIDLAFMDTGTVYNSYVEKGGSNYREILLSIPGLEEKGTNRDAGKSAYESSHFEVTPNIIVHARTTDRGPRGDTLFIEEVQSDLGSDIRKAGPVPTKEDFDRWDQLNEDVDLTNRAVIEAEHDLYEAFYQGFKEDLWTPTMKEGRDSEGRPSASSYDNFASDFRRGYFKRLREMAKAKDPELIQTPYQMRSTSTHIDDIRAMVDWVEKNIPGNIEVLENAVKARDDAKLRLAEMSNPNDHSDAGYPNFPFEGESYYHLAMKRLLRMAVDEGKGSIAWTPAYMQARRWSQAVQNMVQRVSWQSVYGGDTKLVSLSGVNGTDNITVDQSGKMVGAAGGKISTDDVQGKQLSELIGSVMAKRVMEETSGEARDQNIVIGGDGYKIAYDRNIKNFMEKFAKKYGGAVTVDSAMIGSDHRTNLDRIEAYIKDPKVKAADVIKMVKEQFPMKEEGLQRHIDDLMSQGTRNAETILTRAEGKLREVRVAFSEMGDLSDFDRGVLDKEEAGVAKARADYESMINKRGETYEKTMKSAFYRTASDLLNREEMTRAFSGVVNFDGDPVFRVDITPGMRDAILQGQPFSIGPRDVQITPEAQNRISDLLSVVKKVAPRLDVRVAKSIDDNVNAWGKYSRDNGAITIAAFAIDAGAGKQVFGHEMLHAFVDHGLLTPKEIAILQRYSEKNNLLEKYGLYEKYQQAYGPRGLNPADLQRMLNEEGLAELVGEMIAKPETQIPGEIAGIIGRLKRLLERIANAVRGLGFKSSSDILRDITSGDVGARQVEGFSPKDGVLFHLGEAKVASIKRSIADDLGDFMGTDNRVLRRARQAQRHFQDKFLSVKLMQRALADQIADDQNAYLAEELSAARVPELTQEMNDQMQDVLQDLHDAGVSRDLFERFLRLRHAEERNAHIATVNTKFKDGGSGTKTAAAKRWLKMLERVTPDEQMTAMKEAAKKVYAINRKALKYRLDGGLISQDYFNELTSQYRYYVPLKGHEFAEDLKPISGSRGFGARGSGLKQALGRQSEAQNTLSYIVEDYRRAIYSAERNKVNIALYDFIKNNAKLKAGARPGMNGMFKPEDYEKHDIIELDPVRYKRILVKKRGLYQGRKIWVPADFVGDDTKIASYLAGLEGNASERLRVDPSPAYNDLPVMIDGKRHIMRVKNETLLQDLLDMHTNIERIPFLAPLMSGFTRMLTMWNPAFAPTNFARDVMGVGLTAGSELGPKDAGKIMIDAFKMTRVILKSVTGKKTTDPQMRAMLDLYDQMKLSGGSTGFSHVLRDAQSIQKELEVEAEWMAGNRSTIETLRHGIVSMDRFMEKFNRIFEDSTRLAAYKNRLDAGMSDKQALSYAKNITVNFNKRGNQHLFSAFYAFANANFQGNYRMARAFVNGKNGGKVLGGLFAGGFAYGLMNILMGYDDDEPEKINGWYERNQYDKAFYIMLGPIKLPKPHGFMIPFDIGTRAAEVMMAALDPEHCNPARESMASLTARALGDTVGQLTSFIPIGTQEDVALRFVPTLAAPVISTMINTSPFGGPIYPEGFDRTAPNFTKFYAETPEIYHKAAQWMNTLSGGSEFSGGFVNLSPETIEFMMNSYMGGAGGEIRKTASLAMTGLNAALGNETRPIRSEDIPIIRRFLPSQRTNSLTDYYYQFSDRMQEVKTARTAAKDGSEAGKRFLKDHPVEVGMMREWEAAKKQRTAIRKKLEGLDEERLSGAHTGLRRDALINKRALIERRFARSFQINDQIADLKKMGGDRPDIRKAIAKLERDKSVMMENVAKLMADQEDIMQARKPDQGQIGRAGSLFN